MPRETWQDEHGHRFDTLGSREWALKTSRVVVEHTASGQRYPAPAVLVRPDFWDRPPIGPPLAGRRATASGRGHRRINRGDVQARRRRLAYQAYVMRAEGGFTIREIAARLGVGKTTHRTAPIRSRGEDGGWWSVNARATASWMSAHTVRYRRGDLMAS